MFRIQDNVPEVYINESRDFQLISRLYDVLFSSVKYDIDVMINILDATLVKDSMLQLMCSKIGFFPSVEIDANVLKYIIASFPYIIKYKGSERGIEYAVNSILKAENNPDAVGTPYIDIHRKQVDENDTLQEYTVYIYTTVSIYNKKALEEVLKYVIPVGMSFQILQYNRIDNAHPTIIGQEDFVNSITVSPIRSGSIRGSKDEYIELFGKVVNAFDTSQVISSQDMQQQNYLDYKDNVNSINVDKEKYIINQENVEE